MSNRYPAGGGPLDASGLADMWRLRRRGRGLARKNSGFTLIELVIVLAILGIMITLALSRYLGVSKKAYKSEADNVLQEAKALEWSYYQQFNAFDTSGASIGLAVPAGMHWATPSFGTAPNSGISILMSGCTSTCGPVGATDSVWVTLGTDGSSAGGASF
jgi:type IV pilus assembly protein PilE